MDLETTLIKKYKRNFILILSTLIFFFLSPFIFNHVGENQAIEFPKILNQNGLSVTFVDSGVDTNTRKVYVAFSIPFDQIEPLSTIEIIAKKGASGGGKLTSSVKKIFADYYVGTIDVPKNNWGKINLQVSTRTGNEEVEANASENLVITQKGIPSQKVTDDYFVRSYFSAKIRIEKTKIAKAKKKILNTEKSIAELKSSINDLEKSKKTSPDSQVQDIEDKISETSNVVSQKKADIKSYNRKIKAANSAISTYQSNIEKDSKKK